jgi:hypothetical protein
VPRSSESRRKEHPDLQLVREALRQLAPFGSSAEIADAYEQKGLAALARLEARLARLEEALEKATVGLWRYADSHQWLNEREYRVFPGFHANVEAHRVLNELATLIAPETVVALAATEEEAGG